MSSSGREQFGSSLTYIMAMAGSAIGLGNIWRFPYMVGEHGGGAFIIAYIICGLFLAVPCFICEAMIGRRGRRDVYGSFEHLAPGTKWKWMGGVSVLASFIIVSFYCVVGGWSLDFLVRSLSGHLSQGDPEAAAGVFQRMASGTIEPISMYVAFLLATAIIVVGGVKKGIERFTKITTPLLFFLMVAMVIYSVSLPGAMAGVKYLLQPDISKLDASGWACALGQAFFSMSLGMGTVLVYSSFMKKEDSILKGGLWTAVSDTVFAIIAGFAIMPAVFSAGIEPTAGPSLVYETLPYIFAKMGAEAPVLSFVMTVVFFLAILSAALTSSISMLEVCIEHAVHRFGCKRWTAAVVFLIPILALGVPCVLSFGGLSGFKIFGLTVFDLCDYLSSNVLMTLGALAFALFVGWYMKKDDVRDELTNGGTLGLSGKAFKPLYFFIRWVVPPAIIIIFVSTLV
ncbi:MAG: sodium-dependent transporter [Bacteroidales bacterium]|nr:sodium-dependent transporter [Bacteroidales bacterium]